MFRAFLYLFQLLQERKDTNFILKASFLEIYNEKVCDFLFCFKKLSSESTNINRLYVTLDFNSRKRVLSIVLSQNKNLQAIKYFILFARRVFLLVRRELSTYLFLSDELIYVNSRKVIASEVQVLVQRMYVRTASQSQRIIIHHFFTRFIV